MSAVQRFRRGILCGVTLIAAFSICLRAAAVSVETWPCGVIPYQLNNLSAAEQSVFMEAVAEWQNVADVKFIPRSTEATFLLVVHESRYTSEGHATIGMRSGAGLAAN